MKLKFFAKENKHLSRGHYGLDFGWGNGYVIIPDGHKMHGLTYDQIHDRFMININGGLTFSESAEKLDGFGLPEGTPKTSWIIGFDTCHSWDSLSRWPNEQSVLFEAEVLAKQCEI